MKYLPEPPLYKNAKPIQEILGVYAPLVVKHVLDEKTSKSENEIVIRILAELRANGYYVRRDDDTGELRYSIVTAPPCCPRIDLKEARTFSSKKTLIDRCKEAINRLKQSCGHETIYPF